MTTAAKQAEQIAAEGTDVRERVRKLVADRARDGRKTLKDLTSEARDILRGAVEGVQEVGKERRGEVLGEVVDGVSEGLSRAAQATKLAIEEAEGRGERFAEEDLKRAIDDLRSIERMFLDTVSDMGKGAESGMRDAIKDARSHATRAAESMRPAIQSALEAATKHPVKFVGESASAGAGMTVKAIGSLFQVMGGLIAGAGDALRGEDKS